MPRLIGSVWYRLEGTFFQKGVVEPDGTLFQGLIVVDKVQSSFFGVMWDHSPSEIIGRLTVASRGGHDLLEFRKTYDHAHLACERFAAKFAIEHMLSFEDSGGWEGKWTTTPDEGFITMSVVPWYNYKMFPIHPELLYYLATTHKDKIF